MAELAIDRPNSTNTDCGKQSKTVRKDLYFLQIQVKIVIRPAKLNRRESRPPLVESSPDRANLTTIQKQKHLYQTEAKKASVKLQVKISFLSQ